MAALHHTGSLCRPGAAALAPWQAVLVARNGTDIQFGDLGTSMPYLDAVVRETMRLVPSAHGSFRRLLQDVEVRGGAFASVWTPLRGGAQLPGVSGVSRSKGARVCVLCGPTLRSGLTLSAACALLPR